MTSSSDYVLEVRDLVRHFQMRRGLRFWTPVDTVKAVDGVNLTIRRGETHGLVGESGCGKSTLARLIMALDRPTSGEVLFEGTNIFSLSRRDLRLRRRDIQIVLQDPYTALNPRMTVGDLIREPFEVHPEVMPKARRDAAVNELLDRVGLNPHHVNRYPYQFSGGQLQRIGIARALALRPKVIICDEPVASLDVSIQAQVINLLDDLQQDLGLSYLFIAHDLSVVRHVSNRVSVMYLGKIVEEGDYAQIYDRSTHPYTQALHSAATADPERGDGHRPRIVLDGEVPSPINPPSGCRLRTRCWKAQDKCAVEIPALEERPGSDHPTACHFPEVMPDQVINQPVGSSDNNASIGDL